MRGSWVLLPALTVSVVCLAASGYFAVGNLLFLSAAAAAEGRVTANREQWQKGRNAWWRSYEVSVEFVDNLGVRRTIKSQENYHDQTPLGARVPVYYLSEDPTSGRIGGPFLWTGTLRAAVPGVVGLLVFGTLLLASRRRA